MSGSMLKREEIPFTELRKLVTDMMKQLMESGQMDSYFLKDPVRIWLAAKPNYVKFRECLENQEKRSLLFQQREIQDLVNEFLELQSVDEKTKEGGSRSSRSLDSSSGSGLENSKVADSSSSRCLDAHGPSGSGLQRKITSSESKKPVKRKSYALEQDEVLIISSDDDMKEDKEADVSSSGVLSDDEENKVVKEADVRGPGALSDVFNFDDGEKKEEDPAEEANSSNKDDKLKNRKRRKGTPRRRSESSPGIPSKSKKDENASDDSDDEHPEWVRYTLDESNKFYEWVYSLDKNRTITKEYIETCNHPNLVYLREGHNRLKPRSNESLYYKYCHRNRSAFYRKFLARKEAEKKKSAEKDEVLGLKQRIEETEKENSRLKKQLTEPSNDENNESSGVDELLEDSDTEKDGRGEKFKQPLSVAASTSVDTREKAGGSGVSKEKKQGKAKKPERPCGASKSVEGVDDSASSSEKQLLKSLFGSSLSSLSSDSDDQVKKSAIPPIVLTKGGTSDKDESLGTIDQSSQIDSTKKVSAQCNVIDLVASEGEKPCKDSSLVDKSSEEPTLEDCQSAHCNVKDPEASSSVEPCKDSSSVDKSSEEPILEDSPLHHDLVIVTSPDDSQRGSSPRGVSPEESLVGEGTSKESFLQTRRNENQKEAVEFRAKRHPMEKAEMKRMPMDDSFMVAQFNRKNYAAGGVMVDRSCFVNVEKLQKDKLGNYNIPVYAPDEEKIRAEVKGNPKMPTWSFSGKLIEEMEKASTSYKGKGKDKGSSREGVKRGNGKK